MAEEITIIGCGMGGSATMTAEGREALAAAELVCGAGRLVETVARPLRGSMEQVYASYQIEEITAILKRVPARRAALLVSGDSGFYSGAAGYAAALREALGIEARILPGISSLSYLSARTGVSWEDAQIYSLHGRQQNLCGALAGGGKLAILGGEGFEALLDGLCRLGYGASEAWLGQCLGSERERILHTSVERLRGQASEPLSLLLLRAEDRAERTIGIEDDAFIRGNVPMTKSEVRALVLSRLAIGRRSVVYDIGAGTGSVSVEAAIAAAYGQVYAIERDAAALELLRQNKERFLCGNLEIVAGEAPEALRELPAADRVFIGGSGGRIEEILAVLCARAPRARLVVNAVTPETLSRTLAALREQGCEEPEIVQLAVTRYQPRAGYHMPKPCDPVWVMTTELGGMAR